MRFNKFQFVFRSGLVALCLAVLPNLAQASPIKVVAITQDFASIATSIGGSQVSVTSLVKGSQDLHHVNAKPSMVVMVKEADLLIRLGMDQDSWVDDLIKKSGNRNVFQGNSGYLDASIQIPKLDVPSKIDGQGDIHKYGNPHYWLSPKNAKIIAQEIADQLTELDPKNATLYATNLDQFNQKIDQKTAEWRKQLAPLADTYFVTYHGEWRYFLAEFNLREAGRLEPVPGVSPTVRHMAELHQKFITYPHRMVLAADFYDPTIVNQFAKQNDCKAVIVPANVGAPGVSTYIGLIDRVVNSLKAND